MTAIVTGGTGFIGSHLVDALVAAGEETHVVDRNGTANGRYVNPGATIHQLEITDRAVARLIKATCPDIIYHLAAQISVPLSSERPIEDARTNILGSLNLLEAARGCAVIPKFVFVSTGGAIYGDLGDLRSASEDLVCRPISPYGASKLAVEHYLNVYRNMCGMRYGIVRPGNVFGPRQTSRGGAGVVAIFSNAMLANTPITIFGDGSSVRDYVYVSDIIKGILAAGNSEKPGPFNIASGRPTSVIEVFNALRERISYAMKPSYQPERPSDVPGIVLDIQRAKHELGWEPTVAFKQGIAKTVQALEEGRQ